MAPKKSSLKALPKKGVSTHKASQVKGGRKDKLATNHNQTVRKALKPLPKKALSSKKAGQVKGGAIKGAVPTDPKGGGRLAANHNQTLRAL